MLGELVARICHVSKLPCDTVHVWVLSETAVLLVELRTITGPDAQTLPFLYKVRV